MRLVNSTLGWRDERPALQGKQYRNWQGSGWQLQLLIGNYFFLALVFVVGAFFTRSLAAMRSCPKLITSTIDFRARATFLAAMASTMAPWPAAVFLRSLGSSTGVLCENDANKAVSITAASERIIGLPEATPTS